MCDNSIKLCKNLNCFLCLKKSFKSIEYSKNLVDKDIDTRFISKRSNKKLTFRCKVCNHTFNKIIGNVSNGQ